MKVPRNRAAVAISLAIIASAIGAYVFVPSTGSALVAPPGAVGSATPPIPVVTVPRTLNWQAIRRERRTAPDCWGAKPIGPCVLTRGAGETVALIGDSHAAMLIAPIASIARSEHWTFGAFVAFGCPWQDGLSRFGPSDRRACLAHKTELRIRILRRFNPDLVLLVEAPLDREGLRGQQLHGPSGPLATGSRAAEHAIETATDRTVTRLVHDGRDVVIVDPIPQGPQGFDPIAWISAARYLEQCRFATDPQPSAARLHYQALDRRSPHVWALNIDRLACPYFPICDPVVNGNIVWFDLSHLSNVYARTLGPSLDQGLDKDGI